MSIHCHVTCSPPITAQLTPGAGREALVVEVHGGVGGHAALHLMYCPCGQIESISHFKLWDIIVDSYLWVVPDTGHLAVHPVVGPHHIQLVHAVQLQPKQRGLGISPDFFTSP